MPFEPIIFLLCLSCQIHVSYGRRKEPQDEVIGTRIFGGAETNITEVPWQIQILRIPKKEKETLLPICGGAIIEQNYVLTASHCFRKGKNNPNKYLIRAGTSYANGDGGTLHRVVSISVHEDYDVVRRQHSVNDIAVAKIEPPFTYGLTIQKVLLAESEPLKGNVGIASGWGYQDLKKSVRPEIIQKTMLTIMDRESCNTQTNWRGMVPQRSFCAGGDGKTSSCKGDSGGPFVVHETLAGVVSWGYSDLCARKGYPTVFTSVYAFLPWIKEQIYSVNIQ